MARSTSNTVVSLDSSPELVNQTIVSVGANGGTAVFQTDKNIYVTDINESIVNQQIVQDYSNIIQTVNNTVNTPSGQVNGEIQYLDNGAFGSTTQLVYIAATGVLSVTGNIAANNIILSQAVYTPLVSSNIINSAGTLTANNLNANSVTINDSIVVTANVTASNISIANSATVTGNLSAGNVNGGNLVQAVYLQGIIVATSNSQANITDLSTTVNVGNIKLLGNTGNSTIRSTDNQPIRLGTFSTISGNSHWLEVTAVGNVIVPVADSGNTVIQSSDDILIQSVTANYLFDQNGNSNLANTVIANYVQAVFNIGASSQPNINELGTLKYLALGIANGGNGNIQAVNINAGNLLTSNNANITDTANIVLANVANLFVTANANVNILNAVDANVSGNVVIQGNLTVNGNTQYFNIDQLVVEDPIITLGSGANGTSPATNNKDLGTLLVSNPAGTVINRFMGWDTSNTEFALGQSVTVAGEIVTFTELANLRANWILANISGNISGNIINGNSNIIVNANSNVAVSVAGNANIVVVTATGANITGTANITGNVATGNIAAGNLITANFANFANNVVVTSNASANNLSVTANIDGGNLTITGVANITGNVATGNIAAGNLITANFANFANNVVITSNLSSGNLAAGNLITANFANFTNNILVSGNANIGGNVFAANLVNGTSNIVFDTGNSRVRVSVSGNPNIFSILTTGANVDGALNTTTLGVTGTAVAANVTANVVFKSAVVIVTNLPPAATVGSGARSFVSDANTTTWGALVGGGASNNVPVYSDGTSWRVG